ncbi:MAG: NifB/NifX family molybdenum-iron cluster-binding protein [Clostridia bacterium]
MKIAVTYGNGEIFQHFGHCETFKFYDIQDGSIVSTKIVSAIGSGHGALAGFLKVHDTQALICGGIGGGAKTALAEAEITLYPGVTGNADENVQALIDGKLSFNANIICNHHHEEGHDCGEDKHGCHSN